MGQFKVTALVKAHASAREIKLIGPEGIGGAAAKGIVDSAKQSLRKGKPVRESAATERVAPDKSTAGSAN